MAPELAQPADEPGSSQQRECVRFERLDLWQRTRDLPQYCRRNCRPPAPIELLPNHVQVLELTLLDAKSKDLRHSMPPASIPTQSETKTKVILDCSNFAMLVIVRVMVNIFGV